MARRPLLMACLAATATPPVLLVCIGLIEMATQSDEISGITAGEAVVGLAGATVASAAQVLVFGLPIFSLLKRFRLVHWWSLTLAGFLIGAILWGGLIAVTSPGVPLDALGGLALLAALYGGFGAASAFAGWAAWRWNTPKEAPDPSEKF